MLQWIRRLKKARHCLEDVCSKQVGFVRLLNSLHSQNGSGCRPLGNAKREQLCEAAFVVMFAAWEQFLETSFLLYLAAGLARKGHVRPQVAVTSHGTARDLVLGGKQYAEWSDPAKVRDRAKIFFQKGEPYESAISAASTTLLRMKTIRNKCVHHSDHAAQQYAKMLRGMYGASKNIRPGKFLLTSPPSAMVPAGATVAYGTVMELFSDVIQTAATQVVPRNLA